MSAKGRTGGVYRTEFAIGEVVYFRLADEPKPGLVCRITLGPMGESYAVTWDDYGETHHFAIELTRDRAECGLGHGDGDEPE